MVRPQQPSDADYRRLLELRTGLRRFLKWSGDRAEAAGLTPAQHQLLLAVRGHPEPHAPTIGQLADHLLLRHHSTVQLVDRAEAAGWVVRVRDDADHRVARVTLTTDGERVLASLAAEHLEELRRIGRSFAAL
jgi:DNA-binding MarR family transcriptional regulator